jgi:DNA (cytosine-5)-methyltransferase 1
MSGAFYNEIDPQAAAWLRELIAQGLIAPGVVDERDIQDISPADLRGFSQVHLFAGIGVWSYSLRRAGWPDDRPVWTASCPCQPFSSAGKGAGFDDERHLWPAVDWLVQQCQPECIIGEQVASKDAEPWLDLVQADLEGLGYAFGACAFPSAGIGAPHIRDRTYWVADAARCGRREEQPNGGRRDAGDGTGQALRSPWHLDLGRVAHAGGEGLPQLSRHGRKPQSTRLASPGTTGRMGNASGEPSERNAGGLSGAQEAGSGSRRPDGHDDHRYSDAGSSSRLADPDSARANGLSGHASEEARVPQGERKPEHDTDVSERGGADHGGSDFDQSHGLPGHNSGPGPTNGLWGDADWLFCRDGKWRPVEPGTFPLAHGAPARVGRLRGYGNAINAEAAAAFIASYLEVRAAA